MNATKLRLVLFSECNRRCVGCCNKDWAVDELPTMGTSYSPYDMILLTGGEPMMYPHVIDAAVAEIRDTSEAPIIVYTAMTSLLNRFVRILNIVDGFTVTLHEQADIAPFLRLCEYLRPREVRGKSMRLNVFAGIEVHAAGYWDVKRNIEWLADCPLPEGEVLMKRW